MFTIKTLRLFGVLAVLAVIVTLPSCKKEKEGCTDPTSLNYDPDAEKDDGSCRYATVGSLDMQFNFVFGANQLPFEFGTELIHPKTGDTLVFSTFKFYVSNIRLKKEDGTWWSETESYHLVCSACPEGSKITLENIPNGNYTEMEYLLGVDSLRNVSGAQTGDLSVSKGMFWSWNTGYIMLKAEGTSPNAPSGGFTFHLGGFSGADNVVTSKNTDFFGETIAIGSNTSSTVNFTCNPARLWHSSESVSVRETIHMPGPLAKTMATDFYENVSFTGIN